MNECELIFPKAEALVCTERGTLSRLAPLAPGHMGGQVSRAVFTESAHRLCLSVAAVCAGPSPVCPLL